MHEDHPRTRGEKKSAAGLMGGSRGSPPHTRGKESEPPKFRPETGITPAHAGKRQTMSPLLVYVVGSPPHTRGKVGLKRILFFVIGITPAHAGKSFQDFVFQGHDTDHPRTRGEKDCHFMGCRMAAGSPPHTRGKAAVAVRYESDRGITPARAGKSYFRRCHLRAG